MECLSAFFLGLTAGDCAGGYSTIVRLGEPGSLALVWI